MECVRQATERIERETLSPYAQLSEKSEGRERYCAECELRTVYQRDRDRIIHAKSFRRLKHKTQVFLAPEGDHFRTRLTHTLEVSQIARSIARGLRLNEDLTEAIALGHDLGHTPFGHSGETILNRICSGGFRHYEQSLRVVELLENNGEGLNLTKEVRDGIVNHAGDNEAKTLEGKIIKFADRIAYINHDIDDALRAGVITKYDIPEKLSSVLGETHGERINTLILNIIKNSTDKNDIKMSEEVLDAMMSLRQFMFNAVYSSRQAKQEEQKAQNVLVMLFEEFVKDPTLLPIAEQRMMDWFSRERVVCDYIAGMTDNFAVKKFDELFMPKAFTMF
ncbi:MAG: deoxyguanosinetriphosphate triphosphohydrolase [Clostridia bacterium]|nr:deoxyguanosinetriphosphate triphosphohydrolase [Clostridia bacterium]